MKIYAESPAVLDEEKIDVVLKRVVTENTNQDSSLTVIENPLFSGYTGILLSSILERPIVGLVF